MPDHCYQSRTTADTLPDSCVSDYRDNGFVHVRNVIDHEELTEFLADARRLFDQNKTMAWDIGNNLTAFDWVSDADQRSATMRRLTLHPDVTSIAEQLASGALRKFKSELLRKAPHGGGTAITPPHDDRKTFPFRGSPAAITAWVALVDVPAKRGCLSFIPGSHLRSEPQEGDEAADIYPLTHWPELARRPRTQIPMSAGDVTFHHERTIHLAGINQTDSDRISLVTVYMSAAATYRASRFYAACADDPDFGGMQDGEPLAGDRFPEITRR